MVFVQAMSRTRCTVELCVDHSALRALRSGSERLYPNKRRLGILPETALLCISYLSLIYFLKVQLAGSYKRLYNK
jgi:hypothetical protein